MRGQEQLCWLLDGLEEGRSRPDNKKGNGQGWTGNSNYRELEKEIDMRRN